MTIRQNIQRMLVCLCGVGVTCSSPTETPATESRQRRNACDVSTLDDGSIRVRYIDQKGRGVGGVESLLRKQGRIIDIRLSHADGTIRFPNVAPGFYELTVGSRSELLRVWLKENSPQKTSEELTLIRDGQPIGSAGPYRVLTILPPGGASLEASSGPQQFTKSFQHLDEPVGPQ